jgi:UPF0716 protein FxsA
MLLLLVVLFIGAPILELYVASLVADQIGVGPMLLLLLAAVVLGAVVIRRSWRRRPRTSDTALLVLAGVLLLLPGFVSDALGLLLLLPPVRAVAKVWVGQRVERRMASWNLEVLRWDTVLRPGPGSPPAGGPVVQGEVVEGEDDQPPER